MSHGADTDALLARLIKLTARKEDFITECVAAVLHADRRAAADYWRSIGATLPGARNLLRVDGVRTQCRMAGGAARCDMVLDIGRMHVAVEHKLAAVQGRDQLVRYLQLPRAEVSHVAFIAADYQNVAAPVLKNPRFLRPAAGQQHFVWADFYPLLQRSEKRGVDVATATRGLFDRLGLQPAHPLIGLLNTKDSQSRARLDARLYAAWQPLLRTLRRKWAYADSSIRKDRRSEIYVSDGPSSLLQRVWLDPFSNPGSLRIRLRSNSKSKRDEIFARVSSPDGRRTVPHGRYLAVQTELASAYKQLFPWSVEVRLTWRVLLGRSTRTSMPAALKRYVLGLMSAADPYAV